MRKLKGHILKAGIIGMLLFAGLFNIQAQQFTTDYSPLKSTGKLPEIFLKKTDVLSKEEIQNDPSRNRYKERYITSTNYFISTLFLSGQVLVNDPLTEYVNKVAAEVVKQNPGIGIDHVQLFVTKSPEVNAYAFDKGYIFINIGLRGVLKIKMLIISGLKQENEKLNCVHL